MRITGGIPVGGNLGYAGGFSDLVYRGNSGQMQQIRDMYLPGVQGTPFFKKAESLGGFDTKYVS